MVGGGAAVLAWAQPACAASSYVAPDGSDTAAGSLAQPFASLARAEEAAQAGDTVYVRGGTYTFSRGIKACANSKDQISVIELVKSGAPGKPIRYVAYLDEKPVFDFDGVRDSCRIKGIAVEADYVQVVGLEIKRVRQNNRDNHESWGVWVSGSNDRFERLNIHHIMGAGLFIQDGSNNLVLNCDSHRNLDELTSNGRGESADGFGCHVNHGEPGNVFRGCRAWFNSDDGFDFISATGACTVEYSWAWYNGYEPDDLQAPARNGNGFKSGGYGDDPEKLPATFARHMTRSCLSVANKDAGFYANHHPGPLDFQNNTSYGNHPDFNMLGMTSAGANNTTGKYRNNIAFAGTLFSNRTNADELSNSWTLNVPVSDADFESVAVESLEAPRQADGSLPRISSFHLAASSDLIDRGTDVGTEYVGAAPDLGAFERGAADYGHGGNGAGGQDGSGGNGGLTSAGQGGMGMGGHAGASGSGGDGGGAGAHAGESAGGGGAVSSGAGGVDGGGREHGSSAAAGQAQAGAAMLAGGAGTGNAVSSSAESGCHWAKPGRGEKPTPLRLPLGIAIAWLLAFARKRSRPRSTDEA